MGLGGKRHGLAVCIGAWVGPGAGPDVSG